MKSAIGWEVRSRHVRAVGSIGLVFGLLFAAAYFLPGGSTPAWAYHYTLVVGTHFVLSLLFYTLVAVAFNRVHQVRRADAYATGADRPHCGPGATVAHASAPLLWRTGTELATQGCGDGFGSTDAGWCCAKCCSI
jgi:hypothetical protein